MKLSFALGIVLATAGFGFAAEGRVADETLARMGLGDLQAMTDGEGQAIRGQGSVNFTYANTVGASAVPGAFSITQGTAINPNVSVAATGSQSAGFYNPYFLPPMTAFAGQRGFAAAAR
jgi:hypothetical protein